MKNFKKTMDKYVEREIYPFHMPGHKQRYEFFTKDFLRYDLTEVDNLDNLNNPTESLSDLNKRIANPLSSLIILCFLVPGIFLSNLVYWHTANLIIILLFNIAIYLILFFLISKNFIHKK